METFSLIETPQITDKKYVYPILILQGIATTIPWNLFVLTSEYFGNLKLRDPKFTEMMLSPFHVSGLIPSVLFVYSTSISSNRNNIPYALCISKSIMVITVIMICVDTNNWKSLFLFITMFSIIISSIVTGIYTTSIYHDISMFPVEYTNAITIGSNMCGILMTVLIITCKTLISDQIIYITIIVFVIGTLVQCGALVSYFVLTRLNYFKSIINTEMSRSPNMNNIVNNTWIILCSIWLCMFSTFTIFPLMQLKIKPLDSNFIISEYWYAIIMCFLTYYLAVTVGNIVANYINVFSEKYIWIPVLVKSILSIAFFLSANYRPDIIVSDYNYWIGSALFSFVSGYLMSLLMMYVIKLNDKSDVRLASTLTNLIIGSAVMCGIHFELLIESIFDKISNHGEHDM